MLQETGADNVGGPWVARGKGKVGMAIAAAFESPFSCGGARGHDPKYSGPVDTVYLGCWRREIFDRIGLFDEELVRNQDDEFNLRLVRSGGKVWQSVAIKSCYHPRESLRHLFKQYVQYGYWKARVLKKHRLPASVRHLVPSIFVLTLAHLPLISLVWPIVCGCGLLCSDRMSSRIFQYRLSQPRPMEGNYFRFFHAFLRFSISDTAWVF